MGPYREHPNTRLDAFTSGAGIVASAVGFGWLAYRVWTTIDQQHPWEFYVLATFLGVMLYLGWMLWSVQTVTYVLSDGFLTLQQATWKREIDLSTEFHLYRWRSRWAWAGGTWKDLHVIEIDSFPPIWLFRNSTVWVLTYRTKDGEKKAVSFRPSAELLGQIRAWRTEQTGVAG